MKTRLDKYLADSGLGTRSSVRDLIKSGKIKVNDVIEKDSGRKIDTDIDSVSCSGETVSFSEMVCYMLNKPAGVITATEDKNQKTVLDLITDKKRRDLFPVGRLDKDTVGLLIITNDGQLAHRLLAPGKHVSKKYLVRVDGEITVEIASAIKAGVDIGDEKPTAPAELNNITQIDNNGSSEDIIKKDETVINDSLVVYQAEITITEGRYHQIKRMFEAFGLHVIYLKRLSMGSLTLDPSLQEGSWRRLTQEEIDVLKLNNTLKK